jgi:hypothetical protein
MGAMLTDKDMEVFPFNETTRNKIRRKRNWWWCGEQQNVKFS